MTVVVVGAGEAGVETAASLRSFGYDGRIVLAGAETGLPYRRPPLSKALLAGTTEPDSDDVVLRPAAFFAEHGIELLEGARVTALDLAARRVELAGGAARPYDQLVLATGARNRTLPLPGAELDGVVSLRTLGESLELRRRLEQAEEVAIVGAGFIGLEVATAARRLGCAVTVFEIAGRPMSRVLSEPTSAFFAAAHRADGVVLELGAGLERIVGDGRVEGVVDADGRRRSAQVVLVAVGIEPEDGLAAAAGLPAARGVLVDRELRTADLSVSAIGDCARFPCRFADAPVLLESVQNAADQGRAVAARLAGSGGAYDVVPWFWSDQAGTRLQIAGLSAGADETVVAGEPESGKFSVLCFAGGRLRGVESVARPGDHVAARKVLARADTLSPDEARAPGFDLRSRSREP